MPCPDGCSFRFHPTREGVEKCQECGDLFPCPEKKRCGHVDCATRRGWASCRACRKKILPGGEGDVGAFLQEGEVLRYDVVVKGGELRAVHRECRGEK